MQADKDLLASEDGTIQYVYSQQIDDQRLAPERKVYKSIIHDSREATRGILVVVETQPVQPKSMLEGVHLTPRENAVLELLVLGNSQKQIAHHLMISHHTVADHCKEIYRKLGVNSRTEAQLMAIFKLGIG